MAQSITDRADKLLIKLDKQHGLNAIYHEPTGTTVDTIGNVTITYDDTPVKVRSAGLSAFEISQFSASGIGQFDAVWSMRRVYVQDAMPDHILEVGPFFYVIIDKGVSLDKLGILYTLFTRRRRKA